MKIPSYRKLRGYAFDPSFSATLKNRLSNEVIFKVRWEETTPGPCGEYVEVIDFDPTNECFYEPINLEQNFVLADDGVTPSQGNPCFHQQQVYAVIMNVIAQFEKALGTKIIWTRMKKDDSGKEQKEVFVKKLRVYPHGLLQQNAYYSPGKVALIFGYFKASANWNNNNIPGASIFTCLSPDIVAHEATHAILDSLHPYLKKSTNADMLAFHEGFADIIALLQRFGFKEVVKAQLLKAGGNIYSAENMLGDLAIQFGEAVTSHRRALRSYLVEKQVDGTTRIVEPDPTKYASMPDAHSRGGLLVAAVFHALVHLYEHKVADLMRLGNVSAGNLHPDLVNRLADEACAIADRLMMICIRALDYCPPVDLDFGDYLRALITADVEYDPDDEDGLRYALLESFKKWGIIPKNVTTYSVESLMWKPLEEYYENQAQVDALKNAVQHVFNNDENAGDKSIPVLASMEKILRATDRETLYTESKKLAAAIHDILNNNFVLYQKNMEQLLGMKFQPIDYTFKDEKNAAEITLSAKADNTFQVHKCRPVMRYNGKDGTISKQMIITFVQKTRVDLSNSIYKGYFPGDAYTMRGGATVVIDLTTYDIKYAVVKNISSSNRLKKQLDFAMENINDQENTSLLMQNDEPFAALHLHE